MIVSVKNFGQIASASIDMSTFSLFVGHNNSGKTLMMQLIYGVIDYLTRRIDISEHYTFGELPITIDNTNFPEIEAAVNKVLHEKKDEIVFNIFKRRIPIEELWVEFGGEIMPMTFEVNTHLLKEFSEINSDTIPLTLICNYDIALINAKKDSIAKALWVMTGMVLSKVIFGNFNYLSSIFFLPASRTGIQLLSKFFFSAQSEEKFTIVSDKEKDENEYGLTEPMHDFLKFLQTHTHSEKNTEKNAALIRFIETNLIGGKLKLVNGEMWYTPDYDENLSVPPQISSSMVNEFAPIMRVLTGIKQPRCIFYDEVETCLHPLKQIEMARLLVRMVNADYKMIISTHSDTMAAAIDNLILLSAAKDRDEKAKKLGYDENDFLKPEKLDNVHVYQFIVDDSTGKTTVEELENYLATGIGYDFELFQQSNNRLYQDAAIIMDMDGE